ncbi:unnamed protein product, partial [marine sediment metagenome]
KSGMRSDQYITTVKEEISSVPMLGFIFGSK